MAHPQWCFLNGASLGTTLGASLCTTQVQVLNELVMTRPSVPHSMPNLSQSKVQSMHDCLTDSKHHWWSFSHSFPLAHNNQGQFHIQMIVLLEPQVLVRSPHISWYHTGSHTWTWISVIFYTMLGILQDTTSHHTWHYAGRSITHLAQHGYTTLCTLMGALLRTWCHTWRNMDAPCLVLHWMLDAIFGINLLCYWPHCLMLGATPGAIPIVWTPSHHIWHYAGRLISHLALHLVQHGCTMIDACNHIRFLFLHWLW
jgi:hypothetical protein